jgi:quercetin dioxygenase-like cupin family protein
MDSYWFLDTLVRVHVRGEDTGGRYGAVEYEAPPGHQPPPHVHRDDDEGFYVIEGELTLWVGDAVHVLRAARASSRLEECRTRCASATARPAGS